MARKPRRKPMGEQAEPSTIKMPKEFCDDIRKVDEQITLLRNLIGTKIGTAKQLRKDIPKDYVFDLEKGEFVPPPKERQQ